MRRKLRKVIHIQKVASAEVNERATMIKEDISRRKEGAVMFTFPQSMSSHICQLNMPSASDKDRLVQRNIVTSAHHAAARRSASTIAGDISAKHAAARRSALLFTTC